MILKNNPSVIGIYRLTMKTNSDNFRASAIQSIIKLLEEANKQIIIYEPTINSECFENYKVENDLEKFKEISDIIVANRLDDNLLDIKEKIYTRDLFTRD